MIDAQTIRRHSPCTVDTRLRGDGKSLICFLCVLFMPFKLLFIIELIANFIRHFYLTKKKHILLFNFCVFFVVCFFTISFLFLLDNMLLLLYRCSFLNTIFMYFAYFICNILVIYIIFRFEKKSLKLGYLSCRSSFLLD